MDPENHLGLSNQDAFLNSLLFVHCLTVIIFQLLGSPYNHNWISEMLCNCLTPSIVVRCFLSCIFCLVWVPHSLGFRGKKKQKKKAKIKLKNPQVVQITSNLEGFSSLLSSRHDVSITGCCAQGITEPWKPLPCPQGSPVPSSRSQELLSQTRNLWDSQENSTSAQI